MKSARMVGLGLVAVWGMGGCFETTSGSTPQTFDLVYCDTGAECGADFECSPVYCADKCVPDGQGKCASCNAGKFGKCMPKPLATCGDLACATGEVCQTMCTGACNAPASGGADAGKCVDVACEVACVPAVVKCTADADCGNGSHCETVCATGCAAATSAADRAGLWAGPTCPTADCYGTCVKNAPAAVKCNLATDCPEGQVCEGVMCPAICVSDAKGGCLPCNDGFFGVCIAKPVGCQSDAGCPADQRCVLSCGGVCDAFAPGCTSQCIGQCVARLTCANVACGTGYQCQEICTACAGEATTGAAGEAAPTQDRAQPYLPPTCGDCLPQCVPIAPTPAKCNADADCGAGMHCEPMYCTMQCVPDRNGGCLPCNDGFLGQCVQDPVTGCKTDADCPVDQACQTYCMGACDPTTGCTDACQGVCLPKEKGCTADADCASGQVCEWLCTDTCGAPKGAPANDAAFRAPDCTGQCYGQCVASPVQTKCNADADCPAGDVCGPIYCATPAADASGAGAAMPCYPDANGGCGTPLPCNDGFLGLCIPKPTQGCQADVDCPAGDQCQVSCMGGCGAGRGCANQCTGQCVPAQGGCQADADCGAGYQCQQMCVDCATAGTGSPAGTGNGTGTDVPAIDCGGGCYGQCVPVATPTKCNADADCGAAAHCEIVFCTMNCVAPPDGSQPTQCLPCNDGYLGVCTPNATGGCKTDAECLSGETCQALCTGVCDPTTGCSNVCTGQCVASQAGCQADADCAVGQVCQALCPPCVGATDPATGMPVMPCDVACQGQCVAKPATCDANTPCPAGQVCQPQTVCPACVYATPACGAACAVESQCVVAPTTGCQADADCQAWQKCMVACPVTCTPQGCTQDCQGTCTDLPD